MPVAELPEPRRRWKGWMILDQDERFYRFSYEDPQTSWPLQKLVAMGWFVIPVDVVERNS